MSKQRMSVQTVAEILTEELSKIEKHTQRFQEASSRVENATDRVEQAAKTVQNTEIKVNSRDVLDIYNRMVNLMNDRVHIPKWLAKAILGVLISMFIATGVSIWLASHYYTESQQSLASRDYWYDKANPPAKK